MIFIGCSSSGSIKPESIKNKNAIIILGGEMGTKKDLHFVNNYFKNNCNYDIYTIFYKSKHGLDQCKSNLKKELELLPLKKYDKVNFFCFILGGMTLREYLNENEIQNLGNIVLIKGPLEEKLAQVAIDVYPDFLLKIVKGKTLFDLSKIVYKDFSDINSKIGIIIETEPNKLGKDLIKKQKAQLKSYTYEKTVFHQDSLFSGFDDYTYLALDHNEMYRNPHLYISSVVNFFEEGTFGKFADRSMSNYSLEFLPMI